MPHVIEELRRAGNLETVAAGTDRPYRGQYPFLDTDVYKTLEAAAYVLRGASDPAARSFYEEAVDLVGRAQRSDGYLNSAFQNPRYGREPWSDLTWGHELYNLGHLLQAGLAAVRQLGDGRLLAVGRRFADLAVERFGPDVHDCSAVPAEEHQSAVMEPGMVLTVEPGLYFHAHDEIVPPELRGVGVRIEQNLLVTGSGAEILDDALPIDAAGLESWVVAHRGVG